MAMTSHRVWRRILSCVLAYALALQGFLLVFDIGRPAAAAAPDPVWAGFELCSHGGAGATLPDAPLHGPLGGDHCPFCIAGAVYVNCAPPGVLRYSKVVVTAAVWPFAAPRLVALFVNESAWPRGPPSAA